MTKCKKHIVESHDIEEALSNGNFDNVNGTDTVISDDSGSFDLRGIECQRCGEKVNIYFVQNEEDKKYVEITGDSEYVMQWEEPDNSRCVEKHDTYQVFETKKMIEKSNFVQKCNFCGDEMTSMILDHVRKEHPIEYKASKKLDLTNQ